MKRQNLQSAAAALIAAGILVLSSCTSEEKSPPTAESPQFQSSITTQPGVAGGVYQDVITAQAIVSALDLPSRRVTLTGAEGGQFTFTAAPEVRNLPQVKVGDKVNATFVHRIVITVRSDDASPSLMAAVTAASAAKGDKPGMLVAEETEKVARLTDIDSVNRTANLEFAGAAVKNVPVRADVDLSRYKVGDNVVIHETTALAVLVETP